MTASIDRIRAAAGGDTEAFEGLVQHYAARLQWLVRMRLDPALRARVSADDVVQDSLLAASRAIRDLEVVDEPAFWAWLCRIVEHRLIDLHRRHLQAERRDARRERPAGAADEDSEVEFDPPALDQSSPSERLRSVEQRAVLAEALAALAPSHREVIVLRILEGQSVEQTAELLGRSPGAVSVALHKATKRLSEVLARRAVDLGP